VAAQQIVAAGGRTLGTPVDDFVLGLARGRRVCAVPTANMEPDSGLVLFYDAFAHKAECSRLLFNPWPPSDLRAFTLAQDVLLVPGGNTANMLAVWRVHGFDRIVREAWEQGVVLYGWSAGMIAWFEQGVTDSFGPQLEGMDCLGFLPGSACPHYDGEGSAGRGTGSSSTTAFARAGRPTTASRSTSPERSWPRRSRFGRRRGPTASSRARRRRSRPACSDAYARFEASQPAALMPSQIGVSST
jgi:dipeptidase E